MSRTVKIGKVVPTKGVDYFTAEDIASMEDYIINDSTSAFNQNATQKTNDFNTNATNKTTAFNNNATSKTGDFDTNASNKTTTFNNNASSKTGDFNTNATNKTNSFNSNATDKTTAYNNNHTDKVGAYDSNATSKTTDFNDNASAKTTAFNENASEKTTEFNNNASALQEELDYYKTLENALPKVTGTGESITLNDTANSLLSMELEPTELSQDSEPSPSSPQDIHTISGDNEINVKNKNLFDKNNANVIDAPISDITNKISSISTNTYKTIYKRCQPSTTYTISKLIDTTKNRFFIGYTIDTPAVDVDVYGVQNLNTTDHGTITTGSSAKYLVAYVWITGGAKTFQEIFNTIQIEINDKVTSYVPHQEQTAQLNLGDLEYCKIGNYKDRFFKNIPTDADYDATRELGKWYLKKNIGKVVFDGSENWTDQGNGGYATNKSDKYSRYGTDGLICDYFHLRTGTTTSNYEGIDNDTIRIRVWNVGMTLENFKTWLSTHNVTVYYQLATPTYTLLNNTLQSQLETIYNKLLGYQEQTNISQVNNDLPFNINAKAIYDLNKLVERVTELENE